MQDIINQFRYSVLQMPKLIEKINLLPIISNQEYYKLHTDYIVPLDIKIDVDQFLTEIKVYDQYMRPWGVPHKPMKREGLALVNENGKLEGEDRSIGSLSLWNLNHPDNPLIDTDFKITTEVLDIESLKPLRVFDGHWTKSCVLKWGKDAEFVPHIDTLVPAYWYRLWATMDPVNTLVEFYNNSSTIVIQHVEPGRIYLIDTSFIHYGKSLADNVYQLFLSLDSGANTLIEELINKHKAMKD